MESKTLAQEIMAVLVKHGFKSELDADSLMLEFAKEDYDKDPTAIMFSSNKRHEIEGKRHYYVSIRIVGTPKK